MPTVQAATISGIFSEKCRWSVTTLENLREGQSFQLALRVGEKGLASAISKLRSANILVEKDGSFWTVILSLVVFEVRHMLEPGKGGETEDGDPIDEVETLAIVKPKDRNVEGVMLRLLDSGAQEPKFAEYFRQESGQR